MELAFIIVGILFVLTLVYKLVKGAVGLVIKMAIVGTALWALYYFKPNIFS